LLGISLGFDTYKDDPLTDFGLEISTYRMIGEMVKGSGVPGFGVLEGGYSLKIGECLCAFIDGWEGKKDRQD
jgi:acetoin utilization deacetylase AcuC-like enzyme